MPIMTGRCLCGKASYTADGEPIRMAACHCKTCQRHLGTAFSSVIILPRAAVVVAGDLATYSQPGGTSGEPFHRRFCPGCGTPVLWEREGSPRVVILAGTLDDTALFQPTENMFCEFAQSWVTLSPGMRNSPGYPPPE